jgi:hypothetical protein
MYITNKAPEKLDRSLLLRPLPSANIQDRLGQLEKLVMDTLSAAKPSNPSEDVSQLASSFGRMSIKNSEVRYVESAHWTAILDGVCQLTLKSG